MTWFTIYLVTCIPALYFIAATAWEDIQCRQGKKRPCHKFGYNWRWPSDPQWFGFTQIFVIAALIPLANLYFGWVLMFAMIAESVQKRFKR